MPDSLCLSTCEPMTPVAQRYHIKPVFLFITKIVMIFVRSFATLDAREFGSSRHHIFPDCIMDCGLSFPSEDVILKISQFADSFSFCKFLGADSLFGGYQFIGNSQGFWNRCSDLIFLPAFSVAKEKLLSGIDLAVFSINLRATIFTSEFKCSTHNKIPSARDVRRILFEWGVECGTRPVSS